MSAPPHLSAERLGTATTVSGSVNELGTLELLQAIHDSKRSAMLSIRTGAQLTHVFFRNGDMLDVELGDLRGERALYAALALRDGSYEIAFQETQREDALRVSTRRLLWESRQWVDERARRLARLPDLSTVLVVDCARLLDKLAELPDELDLVLKLVDGERSLRDVVAGCELDEVSTLGALGKLIADGILHPVHIDASATPVERPASENSSAAPRGTDVRVSVPQERSGLRSTLDYHLPQIAQLESARPAASLRPGRPSVERTLRGINAPGEAAAAPDARSSTATASAPSPDATADQTSLDRQALPGEPPRASLRADPPRRVRARRKRGARDSLAPSRRARSLGSSSSELPAAPDVSTRTQPPVQGAPAARAAVAPRRHAARAAIASRRPWLAVCLAVALVVGVVALMALLSRL